MPSPSLKLFTPTTRVNCERLILLALQKERYVWVFGRAGIPQSITEAVGVIANLRGTSPHETEAALIKEGSASWKRMQQLRVKRGICQMRVPYSTHRN